MLVDERNLDWLHDVLVEKLLLVCCLRVGCVFVEDMDVALDRDNTFCSVLDQECC